MMGILGKGGGAGAMLVRGVAAIVLILAGVSGAAAQGAIGDLASRTELRVCADPNNLPFSNEQEAGFENKIAGLVGQSMGVPVKYVWFPQVVGFVRNTLRAGLCDVVMGTVAGDDIMVTTTPYYFTSYVLFYRADKGVAVTDLGDAQVKDWHFGVVSGTPPADLLVAHGLMERAKPYALMVDTRFESPTHDMVKDVADGAIDAGLLWGPIAGYYIRHDQLPLKMVLLKAEPGMPRMAYHIAMGVRANEPEWRRRINAEIQRQQARITAILRDFGVPLLDEQGNLTAP
jgi:quinoprotein dehydrogenase-associated probable ABC transporter substrate-binding protein